MAKQNRRPKATLQLKKNRKIGDFVFNCKNVLTCIGNNVTYFPTPSPSLTTVSTDISKLELAETAAKSRVAGTAAARDIAYDVVLTDLRSLLGYVQLKADGASNETNAIAIIEASGFGLRSSGTKSKPTINVVFNKTVNEFKIVAKSVGRRASYNWQYSIDAGLTWVNMPSTLQAKTKISGLALSAKLMFRVQPIIANGANAWSDPVSVQ